MISCETWRRSIADDLAFLGNAEMQRAAWIDGSTVVMSSYPELVNSFLDMLNPSSFMDTNWERLGLTRAQYDLLKQFEAALSSYRAPRGDYEHDFILADPDWHAIQALARQALQCVFGSSS